MQRGREVREQAQAVAGDSDALREAGGQLPGEGGHSFADDVAALMSRQTHPSSYAVHGIDQIPRAGLNAPHEPLAL